MKVFVYDKKDNHIIAIFEHVADIYFSSKDGMLLILDEYGELHHYSRKDVKTRIYQN